jgi:hypothetical protein
MRRICSVILPVIWLVAISPVFPQGKAENVLRRPVQVSEVPAKVLSAAQAAMNAWPTEAKVKFVNGRAVYEISGTNAYFKRVSVDVAGDGNVVRGVDPRDLDD